MASSSRSLWKLPNWGKISVPSLSAKEEENTPAEWTNPYSCAPLLDALTQFGRLTLGQINVNFKWPALVTLNLHIAIFYSKFTLLKQGPSWEHASILPTKTTRCLLPKSAKTLSGGILLPKSSCRWYALWSSVSSFSANTLLRVSACNCKGKRTKIYMWAKYCVI